MNYVRWVFLYHTPVDLVNAGNQVTFLREVIPAVTCKRNNCKTHNQSGQNVAQKLLSGNIDVDVSDFFKLRWDDRNRGHQYKLFLPSCRSSVRQNFLSYRAVQTWNNLPADSTDFSNLRSFKRGLNSSFLARHFAVYYF